MWVIVWTAITYIVVSVYLYYSCSLFVHQKYGYSPRMSSIIVGVVYDLSIVLVPIIGMIIVSNNFYKKKRKNMSSNMKNWGYWFKYF